MAEGNIMISRIVDRLNKTKVEPLPPPRRDVKKSTRIRYINKSLGEDLMTAFSSNGLQQLTLPNGDRVLFKLLSKGEIVFGRIREK